MSQNISPANVWRMKKYQHDKSKKRRLQLCRNEHRHRKYIGNALLYPVVKDKRIAQSHDNRCNTQESFGIAVVRVYQLWGCLNQQQSHPHRQTTEDIEVVYDIQHIIVCVIGQTTFGREIHCKAVS